MSTETKNNTALANQLLLGSQNIDRMICELTQLTRMLIGLILPSTPNSGRLTFVSDDSTILWIVAFGEDALSQKQIRITAYTTSHSYSVFDSLNPESSVKTMIQLVYEKRDVLVNGLLEKIKILEKKLKPFISASQVKLPD